MNCEYFLPVCGLLFHFISGVFHQVTVFSFDKVYFINFFLLRFMLSKKKKKIYAFYILSELSWFPTRSQTFLLCFLLEGLHFMVRYMVHFELTFVYGMR